MKCSILMGIMLTFSLYFSSQVHSQDETDLELRPLINNKEAKTEPGLTWRDVESPLYDFYAEKSSCQSCCDSMSNDRCSCVGCVVGGICGFLFTGCVTAVSYTAYHYGQIQKCTAWCGRGYQGLGWCTPEHTCFSTFQDCENSCDPSHNAYAIGLYSSLGGLVVTGAVTVSMYLVPCKNLVKYCKNLYDNNNHIRKTISQMGKKYKNKEDQLLRDDDIKIDFIVNFLEHSSDFTKKLNKQQKESFGSIKTNDHN